MVRPTPAELEAVRLKSRAWKWLESLRGDLRKRIESENILAEEEFFSKLEMALNIYHKRTLKCPICDIEFKTRRSLVYHSKYERAHKTLYRLYQLVVSGEKELEKDRKFWGIPAKRRVKSIVKGRRPLVIRDTRDEIMNADPLVKLSNYNLLRMYLEEPKEKTQTEHRRRVKLIKLGLLYQEYEDRKNRVTHLTKVGEELWANPPTI